MHDMTNKQDTYLLLYTCIWEACILCFIFIADIIEMLVLYYLYIVLQGLLWSILQFEEVSNYKGL